MNMIVSQDSSTSQKMKQDVKLALKKNEKKKKKWEKDTFLIMKVSYM